MYTIHDGTDDPMRTDNTDIAEKLSLAGFKVTANE